MKNAIFVLVVLLPAFACQARTITVDDDLPADFNNIQAAIDDANDGDTVIIAPGTYTGPGNRDIDFKGKAITVRSIDPNDPNIVANTVIDCQFNTRAFTFSNRENAGTVVDGFTIVNGGPLSGPGGAIYVAADSSPYIVNLDISNCSVTGANGGAIFVDVNSSPSFRNVAISDCIASTGNGGGIYLDINSTPTFIECSVSNCAAFGGSGGAVYCNTNYALFIDCRIIDNHGIEGGGIFFVAGSAALANCMFIGNEAQEGGGVYSCNSVMDITNCTFSMNSAHKGGGIFVVDESYGVITNCILWGNMGSKGSQIAVGTYTRPSRLRILYSDIQLTTGPNFNTVPIYVEDDCTLEGYDPKDPNNPLDPNDPNEPWDPSTHNIWDDPNFVFDYYLSQFAAGQTTESNCVDGGSTWAFLIDDMWKYTTRIDGVTDKLIVDMGYHHKEGVEKYELIVIVAEDPNDPGIHGTVEPNSGWYYEGTELTLTATGEPGYYLKGWYDTNDVLIASTRKLDIVMDSNQVFVAKFRLPSFPIIGLMLGAPVSRKIFTDRNWRDEYGTKVLAPALKRIGQDAPGTYIKFFVPWGDPEVLGGSLDNAWAYNHQWDYEAVFSDDKTRVILSRVLPCCTELTEEDVSRVVGEYCYGTSNEWEPGADWEDLRWLMQLIDENHLRAYPILGDGGGTPKIALDRWLVPDQPEQYVAHLYIHARAVVRMFLNGEMPGGRHIPIWQIENETNYASAHAALGWRKPSVLWSNPQMQEAIIASLRNAIRDEYVFWMEKGLKVRMAQIAIDLHVGYKDGDLFLLPYDVIPFDQAAAALGTYTDLIAFNDYAFTVDSLADVNAAEAAETRLHDLAIKLKSAGVYKPAYVGETTYPSGDNTVYSGDPEFAPHSQAEFLTDYFQSYNHARGIDPALVPSRPVFFWYQITDSAGLDQLGLNLPPRPIMEDLITWMFGDPEPYSGLFEIRPGETPLLVPKEAYWAYIAAARSCGRLYPAPDIDGDQNIDSVDYAMLANQWLKVPSFPSADIVPYGGDGIVDFRDLSFLLDHWLEGTTP